MPLSAWLPFTGCKTMMRCSRTLRACSYPEAAPFRIDDPVALESFRSSVMLGGYVIELTEPEQQPFVRSVQQAVTAPVTD